MTFPAINHAIWQGMDKIEGLRAALDNDWIDKNETMRLLNATKIRVARLSNLRKLMTQRAAERASRGYDGKGHLVAAKPVDCNNNLKKAMAETGNMDCQVRFLTARGLK